MRRGGTRSVTIVRHPGAGCGARAPSKSAHEAPQDPAPLRASMTSGGVSGE